MKVLLATDGEFASELAERLLVRLADRDAVEPTAFSVTTYDIDPADEPKRTVEDARSVTNEVVDALSTRLEKEGFRVDRATSEGDPGAEIVRRVEAEGFDLTVVGAGRHAWLRARLLGTSSSYVVHNSPSSVLIVRDCRESRDPVKVLVATDGSDDAGRAIRSFAEFADPSRCSVSVVSIAQPSEITAQQNVNEARGLLNGAGVATEGFVLNGSPSPRLLEMMREGGYEVIVLGSRGLGPVRRALLGSVSDQIAHHAPASFIARSLGNVS